MEVRLQRAVERLQVASAADGAPLRQGELDALGLAAQAVGVVDLDVHAMDIQGICKGKQRKGMSYYLGLSTTGCQGDVATN
jgi:hypothetical protein